jgi:hypothetical protein
MFILLLNTGLVRLNGPHPDAQRFRLDMAAVEVIIPAYLILIVVPTHHQVSEKRLIQLSLHCIIPLTKLQEGLLLLGQELVSRHD